jgi:hypothetical protein
MAIPVLTRGAETWTVTASSKRNLEATEMRILRSVTGVNLVDQKRTENIRKDLKIFKLTFRLVLCRRQWKQHLEWMDDNCIPKRM